jgi:hypothetical protein
MYFNWFLTTVILARSNNALPDVGDYTKTRRSCFNVNFNVDFETVFKTIHLCIIWWIKNFDNAMMFSHHLTERVKGTGQVVPVWRHSRDIGNKALVILNFDARLRWAINFIPQLLYLPRLILFLKCSISLMLIH